LENAEEMPVE